ncbi:MAG: bifunctional folylpolyglutamate synthase/dihydrofolate synthase [Oscillospiraceae bacterium]|nr:bifunctional folylpolyglutamate synthase/dihydrofolate synthase [Oscillospiraceae bacterium]
MGYTETLEYIHNVKWQAVKPGLSRTRELLAALGNPEQGLKFVHVAGTNGKGSTAACISSVLRKAGYRTGLYISPYIIRFNERFQVDGAHIADDELVRLTDEIRPIADAMAEPPTEFELITAIAMKHFYNQKCDIVVLEVGMGGELDSTNVIDTPEVAVITTISLEHVKELGPEITDIARAKAGIIKAGGDVVVYGGLPEVEEVFERTCREKGARLQKTDFSRISRPVHTLEHSRFDFAPYGEITLPLAGTYQPRNAAVAVTALEVLRAKGYAISDADIVDGLAAVNWPGRFELLGRDPVFILDGTHNPEGIEATAASLKSHFPGRKIVFIIGVMADKDVDSMIAPIAVFADAFYAVRPDYPRAMNTQTLANKLSPYGAPVFIGETVASGVNEAIDRAGADGIVCAIGSLYFSGDIRSAYEGRARSHN